MAKYRRILFLIGIVLLGSFYFRKPVATTYFIPFDEAQIQESFSPKELVNFYQRQRKKKWRLLNHLYKQQISGRKKRHLSTHIPKIIHQIWLDGPIPQQILETQKTWQEKHPSWEYHLWTKEEIALLYLKNANLYESSIDPKQKSDILRYEILYQFGGVFVENDLECLRPLDILNENCDFYAGLTDQIRTPQISNALIAAIPSHPILKKCINTLRERTPHEVWGNLGPSFLTHCFFQTVKKKNPHIDVALPSSFFFPLPHTHSTTPAIGVNTFACKRQDL